MLRLMQDMPVNSKDWSFLPTTVLAIAFLVGVGIWAAKQLGLVKTNGNGKKESHGKEPTVAEQLNKQFEDLEERIDNTRSELTNSIRDLAKAINDLTFTLLRGK